MKTLKRIFAIIGIILLLGLYVAVFITAIFDDPNTFTYFKIALGATIIVPVGLWVIGIFLRISKSDQSDNKNTKNGDFADSTSSDEEPK